MAQKLIYDSYNDDDSREFYFLTFSSVHSDFRVKHVWRRGEDYRENEITVNQFLVHANEAAKNAFFEYVSIIMSI